MPELTMLCRGDLTTQNLAAEVHPIADAENGNAQVENGRVALGCPLAVDTGRAAGEYDTLERQFSKFLGRDVGSAYPGEDIVFAVATASA